MKRIANQNVFEAVLEGSSFWYLQTLFWFFKRTNTIRRFLSWRIFENENTITLIEREWVYIIKDQVLRMKNKGKKSYIFSKKTKSLYHREIYRDSSHKWRKAFFGLSFMTCPQTDGYIGHENVAMDIFVQKVAESQGLCYRTAGDLAQLLFELRTGSSSTNDFLDAKHDVDYNKTTLKQAYAKVRKGIYKSNRENDPC